MSLGNSVSMRRLGRRGRGATIALALATTAGCAGEAVNAIAPDSDNARVASVAIRAVDAPLFAGDTVQLMAEARDDAGRVVPDASIGWTVSNDTRAVVDQRGRLVGVGHGPLTVTATAGRATASREVITRLTTEERRFGYAWVHDATTSTTYGPNSTYQFNETGGGITVSRQATGEYVVSFERMAKVDSAFRETVLVTPFGAAGERCRLNGWGDAPNGRDLDVSVSCYTFSGTHIDTRFSVLVVGSRSLPSRMGFTVAGDASSAFAPQPNHTYSSFADHVGISRSAAGSYLVQMDGAVDNTPQNYFVSTYGTASDLCKVSSWNRGVWASVICYASSGALTDSRFSLLMVERGRPDKRFGFAWANEPSIALGSSYTPNLEYQRTSSGQPVRIGHSSTGAYQVVFPGLGKVGNRPETVQVSPYGGGLYTCQVQGWTSGSDGASLDATVRCWNSASGEPADTYFTILVVE